jgi:hypothetical protein
MDDASNFLTSLALGDALSGIGLSGEASEGLERLGVVQKGANPLDRDAIYNEVYADDDLSDSEFIKGEDETVEMPALIQPSRITGEDDDYDFDGEAQEAITPMDTDNVQPAVVLPTDEEIEELMRDPPQVININQLFPTFAPDKNLDFTELLSTRPRKRQKLSNNPVKSEPFDRALLMSSLRTKLLCHLPTRSQKLARPVI